MALTGIQIFKLLPKTNCKECGVPTCLAFAMNLASGKAELDACPYVSDEAREKLAEASAPPIRPVASARAFAQPKPAERPFCTAMRRPFTTRLRLPPWLLPTFRNRNSRPS